LDDLKVIHDFGHPHRTCFIDWIKYVNQLSSTKYMLDRNRLTSVAHGFGLAGSCRSGGHWGLWSSRRWVN
jgi:hypothetical protein